MGLHNPAFSVEEYRQRLAKVQAAMRVRGLDALLLNNRADVCYVTGMENCYMVAYHAAVVPASGDPMVLASDFEMLNALVGVWCSDRVTFRVRTDDPVAATARALCDRGFGSGRIGIQPSALSLPAHHGLKRGLPNAELLDADDLMWPIKTLKSAEEIRYLRQAGSLTARSMDKAMAAAVSGVTDNDVAAAALDVLIRGGSEFMCLDPIVTVGARSGIPHTTFRRTAIRPGDAVFIEIGACLCRYSAPMMRSVLAPPVAAPVQRALDACRACLGVLIPLMQPGAAACDVARKAEAVWRPLCEELIWHGYYAYSVGLGFPPDWSDGPASVTTDSDLILEPGMCFHATTSLRKAAEYGVTASETVLVTEQGPEILTRPAELPAR